MGLFSKKKDVAEASEAQPERRRSIQEFKDRALSVFSKNETPQEAVQRENAGAGARRVSKTAETQAALMGGKAQG